MDDADPGLFEPHHAEIDDAAQVQIYEPILAAPDGTVTTVLTSAASYVKDNRLLPDGFDKMTADDDIAVHGRAADDGDFVGGGDRVRYSVELTGARGPLTVEAELLYQPIAYRWARNLGDRDAPEIERFASYYDSMAGESATVLARDIATTR